MPHTTLNGLIGDLHNCSFHKSMHAQDSPTLPAIYKDAIEEKVYFNTSTDITDALEIIVQLASLEFRVIQLLFEFFFLGHSLYCTGIFGTRNLCLLRAAEFL
jgi:hypothetical protein